MIDILTQYNVWDEILQRAIFLGLWGIKRENSGRLEFIEDSFYFHGENEFLISRKESFLKNIKFTVNRWIHVQNLRSEMK